MHLCVCVYLCVYVYACVCVCVMCVSVHVCERVSVQTANTHLDKECHVCGGWWEVVELEGEVKGLQVDGRVQSLVVPINQTAWVHL